MRSTVLCLTLLVALSACETSTDPFIGIGGSGPTAAQVTGNWAFTLHPSPSCGSGSLPDGQILTARLDVLADGTVTNATSTWQTAGIFGTVTGFVNLTSGVTTPPLTLTATAGSAMELAGTFTSAGSFSGTVTDPKAGSFTVFSASLCSYSTTGVKTS